MDLKARVNVNCERKDGHMDGPKTGCLCRTLLKQVQQKLKLLCMLPYFFGYKTEFISFQNNPKNLDPSYKMDLDFGIVLEGNPFL